MDFFLNMLVLNLLLAAMYGVLALGVYITYSILDFPDLSVDGTVPLGGVVSAMLILKGVNPWLALLAAFAAGAGISSAKEPSAPVLVPTVVPLTMTVAPMMGTPFLSRTCPITLRGWSSTLFCVNTM